MIEARSWLRVAPAAIVVAWGGNHFTPLLLLYRQTNGYSALDVDVFFATYIVGLIPGFLISGPLSDRYGRKPVMTVGILLAVIGSVVLALGSSSFMALALGRLISGASVAIAMTVATTWIKELSAGSTSAASGARRASLSLTAGFGGGAAVSGVLAQWGPWPTLLPYLIHITLTVVTGVLMLATPETRRFDPRVTSLLRDLRPLPPHRRRFAVVVVPAALWVFAASALAFAVGPALVADRVGEQRIAFATLLTIITMGTGVAVQPFSGAITRVTRGRPLVLGLLLTATGTLILALDSQLLEPWLAIVAAVFFGAGYGICMVCGLIEVQAMASPDNLGGLTSVFYSLTYVGFSFPAILSALAAYAPFGVLLLIMAALCLACAVIVGYGNGRRAISTPPVREESVT